MYTSYSLHLLSVKEGLDEFQHTLNFHESPHLDIFL